MNKRQKTHREIFSQHNRNVWWLFSDLKRGREEGYFAKIMESQEFCFCEFLFFVKVSLLPEVENGVNTPGVCISACSLLTPPHSLELCQHLGGPVRNAL